MKSLALICLILVSASSVQAAPGELWETRLVMHSKQHGRMEMPSQQICQKPVSNDTINPADVLPKEARQCAKVDTKQVGNTVTYSMDCPQGKYKGSIRLVARGMYEGEMESKTKEGDFKLEFKGRRVGGTCQLGEDG